MKCGLQARDGPISPRRLRGVVRVERFHAFGRSDGTTPRSHTHGTAPSLLHDSAESFARDRPGVRPSVLPESLPRLRGVVCSGPPRCPVHDSAESFARDRPGVRPSVLPKSLPRLRGVARRCPPKRPPRVSSATPRSRSLGTAQVSAQASSPSLFHDSAESHAGDASESLHDSAESFARDGVRSPPRLRGVACSGRRQVSSTTPRSRRSLTIFIPW